MSVAMSSDPYQTQQRMQWGPSGRVRDETTPAGERNYCVGMHLSPLAALVFGPLIFAPLVMWLIRKDDSSFVDDHGREIINFWLSSIVIFVVCLISLVGVLFIPVQMVIILVSLIRGAVAASNGEYFRYPMTIRFLN